jgi:hypothetical protein
MSGGRSAKGHERGFRDFLDASGLPPPTPKRLRQRGGLRENLPMDVPLREIDRQRYGPTL